MELFKEEFANEQVPLPEIKRPCSVYKTPHILLSSNFLIVVKKILLINVPNASGSTAISNATK